MSNEWNEITHAVATKSLDDALQYVIYELKTDITRALEGVRILDTNSAHMNTHEVCDIVETSLTRTLEVIDHLIIDIYLPRLQPQQDQPAERGG